MHTSEKEDEGSRHYVRPAFPSAPPPPLYGHTPYRLCVTYQFVQLGSLSHRVMYSMTFSEISRSS